MLVVYIALILLFALSSCLFNGRSRAPSNKYIVVFI